MNSYCVLIYSNYSKNSKKIMEILKSSPVDLTTNEDIKLNLLCIDNETVRKKILNSTKLSIEKVPCVLVVHADGGVEKYDGVNAFNFIEEIIGKLKTVSIQNNLQYNQQPQFQQPPIQQPQFQQPQFQQPPIQPPQIQPPQIQSNDTELFSKPVDKKTKSKITSVDDIETEEEEDEEEVVVVKKKKKTKKPLIEQLEEFKFKNQPVSIRTGPGNYELSEEFGEISPNERPNDVNITKAIKKDNAAGIKKNDLMTNALAMQKSREQEEAAKPSLGMPPFQER